MKHLYDTVANQANVLLKGAFVTVFVAGTNTLAPLFSDNGITPKSNPVVTNNDGVFDFYVADGLYDFQVSGTNIATFKQVNVEVADVTSASATDLEWQTEGISFVNQSVVPPRPPTGNVEIFALASNKHLFQQDDAGVVTDLALGSGGGGGGGTGTVTSVAMQGDGTVFAGTVPGSPITISGTLTPALLNQPSGTVLAGPATGPPGPPTWQSLSSLGGPAGFGTGTVTSVGLQMPLQYSVASSPVTTAGTLGVNWNPVFNNAVLAGPCGNCVGGIVDSPLALVGNGTSIPATFVPTNSTDMLWLATAVDINSGQTSQPTFTPPSLVLQAANNTGQVVYATDLTTSNPVSTLGTLSTSGAWCEVLFGLKGNGIPPTVVNSRVNGGAFSPSTSILTTTFTSTAGNAFLLFMVGNYAGKTFAATPSDNQNNLYTPIALSANTNAAISAWITANIAGGNSPTFTFSNWSGSITSAGMMVFEINNLALGAAVPTFRYLAPQDLPPAIQVSNQSFSQVSLSSDVTVGSTATAILQKSITMPQSGCPCRVFVLYSLYLDFAAFTNVKNWNFWVNDGAGNTFAGLQTGQSNASSGGATSASNSAYSFVTYNNKQTVTFTLLGQGPSSNVIARAVPSQGLGNNSYMQILVQTSN